MCNKRSNVKAWTTVNDKLKEIRVDGCIRHLPFSLSSKGFDVVACCCGHGKYPLTVICKNLNPNRKHPYYDLISGKDIPRNKRYYVRDKKGYFYIPESIQISDTK